MGTMLVETGSIWRRIFLLDRVAASEEQKAGLARVLQSRYHRLCAGKLYCPDGGPLREPTEAITLDTGMMLIGLSECLRCSSQAEKALRDIIILFFGALGTSTEVCHKINRAQLELATSAQNAEPMDAISAECPADASLEFCGDVPVCRRFRATTDRESDSRTFGHSTVARRLGDLLQDGKLLWKRR